MTTDVHENSTEYINYIKFELELEFNYTYKIFQNYKNSLF